MTSLPRWSEGDGPGDPGLRAALIDARRGPSEAELTRLAEAVALRARQPSAGSTPWLTRAVIGLASVMLVSSAAWWWSLQQGEQPVPAPTREARSTPPALSTEPAAPASAPSGAEPAPQVTSEATPARARSNAPTQKRREHAQRQVADDVDEVRLLQAARRALLAQPAEALALTQQHTARFARGLFVEEREAIAIEALFKLGRATQANPALTRFLRDYPRSTYRVRLMRLVPTEAQGER